MGIIDNSSKDSKKYAFRIYTIIKKGPLDKCGAKELTDFIIPPDEVYSNQVTFEEWAKTHSNQEIVLSFYSLLTKKFRDIKVKTNPLGSKEGILGASVQYENWTNANKKILHIISVKDNSFAQKELGLIPFEDYIVGVKCKSSPIIPLNNDDFSPLEILSEVVRKNMGNPVKFYIYNRIKGPRDITSTIENDYYFTLGCEGAFGALHMFPSIEIVNNNVNGNETNNNIYINGKTKEINDIKEKNENMKQEKMDKDDNKKVTDKEDNNMVMNKNNEITEKNKKNLLIIDNKEKIKNDSNKEKIFENHESDNQKNKATEIEKDKKNDNIIEENNYNEQKQTEEDNIQNNKNIEQKQSDNNINKIVEEISVEKELENVHLIDDNKDSNEFDNKRIKEENKNNDLKEEMKEEIKEEIKNKENKEEKHNEINEEIKDVQKENLLSNIIKYKEEEKNEKKKEIEKENEKENEKEDNINQESKNEKIIKEQNINIEENKKEENDNNNDEKNSDDKKESKEEKKEESNNNYNNNLNTGSSNKNKRRKKRNKH